MIIDQNRTITRINKAGALIFDCPEEAIINNICHDSVCPQQLGKCPIWDKGMTVHQKEVTGLRADGSLIALLKSAVKIDDFILEMFIDISDITSAREQTLKAKADAETANQSKSQFLANTSHELKTPMNAIIGYATVALTKDLSPELRGYLNGIEKSSRSLMSIINNILDFSKIDAELMQLNSLDFNLDDILNTLNKEVAPNARKKGLGFSIEVSTDIPNALIGDSGKLEQVLSQLLSNAVKYTEKGQIRLKVNASKVRESEHGVMFSFIIEDTGTGIAEEQMDKLFQTFIQGDGSSTRTHGGLGLGLALSKKLVDLMEGNIFVESEPGQGSTFTFSVKLEQQSGIIERPVKLESINFAENDMQEGDYTIDPSINGTVDYAAIDIKAIKILLTELIELVEIDIIAAFERLNDIKVLAGTTREIENIEAAINDYDSDAALDGIVLLAKKMNIYLKEQ